MVNELHIKQEQVSFFKKRDEKKIIKMKHYSLNSPPDNFGTFLVLTWSERKEKAKKEENKGNKKLDSQLLRVSPNF